MCTLGNGLLQSRGVRTRGVITTRWDRNREPIESEWCDRKAKSHPMGREQPRNLRTAVVRALRSEPASTSKGSCRLSDASERIFQRSAPTILDAKAILMALVRWGIRLCTYRRVHIGLSFLRCEQPSHNVTIEQGYSSIVSVLYGFVGRS